MLLASTVLTCRHLTIDSLTWLVDLHVLEWGNVLQLRTQHISRKRAHSLSLRTKLSLFTSPTKSLKLVSWSRKNPELESQSSWFMSFCIDLQSNFGQIPLYLCLFLHVWKQEWSYFLLSSQIGMKAYIGSCVWNCFHSGKSSTWARHSCY